MLDLKFIRANPELVRTAARQKCADVDIDRILELDAKISRAITAVEELRRERNEIAREFKDASETTRAALSERSRTIGEKISSEDAQLNKWKEELHSLLLLTPNIPDPTAPIGPDAESNRVVRQVGEIPSFGFTPLDHVDLLEKNNWADLKRVTDISGSRTYSLKGMLVRLELALMNFALDRLTAEGFTPISVPPFAREQAFLGTGHFPLGREEAYYLPADDLYLVGTSEVIINSLHSGEILSEAQLPLLYAGFSGCYRREAGSGGKDVRGLLRVHHFMKVEQFVICRNDDAESRRWHEKLLGISESILAALELPYQVVECSTGDMGLGKYRMNDIECWVPSLGTYRETHSCSTLHEWQSRRTNTRYREADLKSIKQVHTLNNTAIATPRIFAPLLEIHQRADGHVAIPRALQNYLGGLEII